MDSSSSRNKKGKLSVRKQTLFKKSSTNLLMRQETILKKAGELSTLCDNLICVIHYDNLGNVVKTWPVEQSQVQDIAERYSQLTDEEKQKKSTNLSKFLNKKMHDEKKRFPIKFSQKLQDFKGSLVHKLQLLQDMMLPEDQSSRLAVMSEQNHNFPHGFVSKDSSSSSSSLTNLVMNGGGVSEQDMSRDAHQSKFSIFMFNHENATFTQLPHSVSSSLEPSLIPYYNDNRDMLGAQGLNDNNNLTTQGFNFGYDNNGFSTDYLPGEQVNYNSLGTQGFGYDNNLNTQGFNFGYDFNNLCT